jgi:hypothetical protein
LRLNQKQFIVDNRHRIGTSVRADVGDVAPQDPLSTRQKGKTQRTLLENASVSPVK